MFWWIDGTWWVKQWSIVSDSEPFKWCVLCGERWAGAAASRHCRCSRTTTASPPSRRRVLGECQDHDGEPNSDRARVCFNLVPAACPSAPVPRPSASPYWFPKTETSPGISSTVTTLIKKHIYFSRNTVVSYKPTLFLSALSLPAGAAFFKGSASPCISFVGHVDQPGVASLSSAISNRRLHFLNVAPKDKGFLFRTIWAKPRAINSHKLRFSSGSLSRRSSEEISLCSRQKTDLYCLRYCYFIFQLRFCVISKVFKSNCFF